MNKKGFTLIEIIIVIVILGVLATLALPRITGQIKTAEGAEAMNVFGAIKRASIQCLESANGDWSSCYSSSQIGVNAPVNGKFTYTQASTPAVTLVAATAVAREFCATNTVAVSGVTYRMMMRVEYDPNNGEQATRFWADSSEAAAPVSPTGAFAGIVSKTGAAGLSLAAIACPAAGAPAAPGFSGDF